MSPIFYIFFILILPALILLIVLLSCRRKRYDRRGFDGNRIHKNGTKYDDRGYDYFGYNAQGYNEQGYTLTGRNQKGQYNRLFDTTSTQEEGFRHLYGNPVQVPKHARERFAERMNVRDPQRMEQLAKEAYCFGKSRRQIKFTSRPMVEDIEQRHGNGIVLIYHGFIYIFSPDNKLITLYKNERIPL